MATSRLSIEPWDGKPVSLRGWMDRLKQLFVLDGSTATQQVASLLVHIGTNGYQLLEDLTYPNAPSTKKFDELTKLLEEAVMPQELVIAERSKFYAVTQARNEDLLDYSNRVKRRAATCLFPDDFLDQALRDRLVCGLFDERIRALLLAEPATTTFAQALEKIRLKLTAGDEAKRLTIQVKQPIIKSEVFRVDKSWDSIRCERCKLRGHKESQCHTKCHHCGKTGHILADCRKKNGSYNKNGSSSSYNKAPKKTYNRKRDVGAVDFDEGGCNNQSYQSNDHSNDVGSLSADDHSVYQSYQVS